MAEQKKRNTRRRGRGEGGVYQRESDGRWCGSITVGFDVNGKRIRKTVYGKTKRQCLDKLHELKTQKKAGTVPSGKRVTVREFLLSWVEAKHSGRTFILYRQAIVNHLNPHLGGFRVCDLTSVQIQLAVSRMAEGGASPSTTHHAIKVLRSALNQAVKQGVASVNPAASGKVTTPKVERKEMTALTSDQARAFLAHVEGDRNFPLYQLGVSVGLRIGELITLKWTDLDLQAGSLKVLRSATEKPEKQPDGKIKRVLAVGKPKTATSRRTIQLPAMCVFSLMSHQTAQQAGGYAGEWVFPSKAGEMMTDRHVRQQFAGRIKGAGIPTIRFHDLRHTAASLMMAEGVHPKIVQATLGHASVEITLGTYGHLSPFMTDAAADTMDRLLSGEKTDRLATRRLHSEGIEVSNVL